MSLDISFYDKKIIKCPHCGEEITTKGDYYESYNITHNLTEMAMEAGIYTALWEPYKLYYEEGYFDDKSDEEEDEVERTTIIKAKDLIPLLNDGLQKLLNNPDYYKQFNAPNGWGVYEHFVVFVEKVSSYCKDHPDFIVEVSR